MQTPYQTASTLLQNAKRVALFPVSAQDVDAVAAAIALAESLDTRGITPTIYLDEPASQKTFGFLAGSRFIQAAQEPSHELVIDIPNTANAIAGISYERTADRLRIHITPKNRPIAPSQVHARQETATAGDVFVVLGARRLTDLGQRFTSNAEVFYRTPIIALDYHIDAEPYASVHITDHGSRSYTALVYQLLAEQTRTSPASSTAQITPAIATALLAGVLAQSQSFQRSMTSPQEFELAATLLEQGADRHAVIQHLYKTKPLPLLKLWGRVLSRLSGDPLERVWFTQITAQDFTETNTDPNALIDVMREVLSQSSQAKLVTIAYAVPADADKQHGSVVPESGLLIGSAKEGVIQRYLSALKARMPVYKQTHNEHIAHVRVRAPLTDATVIARQLGEQILRPGYTEATNGTRSTPTGAGQRATKPTSTPAGRPVYAQPKLTA